MAALTWRSVAAPDFSGIQGGISNAGEFFNRGFNTVQKTLDNVQTIREDNAVREVLGRALASNDPAAIQAMAAEAAQNPNFTMRGLDTLNRQVDTLQRRNLTNEQINTARQAREQGATLFDRESNLYAARQAAAPIIAEAMSKGESPEAAMKTLSGNPATAGLGVNDITSIYNSFLNSRGENLNYNIRSTEFAQGQADRADREAGQNYVSSVLSNTLDSSVARQRIDADVAAGRLTPGAAAYARRAAGLDSLPFDPSTGMPRGVPGMGVPAGTNIDPLRTMNYEARGKGFTAVPASVQTMGQFRDYARTVNNAGVASSAAGPWQMVGSTAERHAKNLWGADWQNRPFSIESLDKLAEAAFNERVSRKDPVSELRNEWEALRKLPDEQVRALANAGWSGARNTIAALESSASPDVLRLEGASLNANRDVKRAETDVSGIYGIYNKYSNDDARQSDVIADLTKSIPGADAGKINSILGQVVQGAGVKYKVAGEAIKNALTPVGFLGRMFPNDIWLGTNTGSTAGNVDVKGVIESLKQAKKGAGAQAASDLDTSTRQNQQAQARAIASQADVAYQNAEATVLARGLDPAQLEPYRQRRDQAWANVDALQRSDPDRQSSPAPQGKPQSGRPSVAQVARPSQGSGNAIDKYGQDWRSRARAVREATGARRVTLEDQFQRLYGKSIPQAEAENASREKSAAQAVLRLGGAIGQKQRAEFQRTYGRTPEAALGR